VTHRPLRFEPYLRPLVWGGRGLADLLGVSLAANETCAEAWLISDHASHRSATADGRTLRQFVSENAHELLGGRAAAFPWLVKLIDARDWLSVQVHPDDWQAARLWPGEGGKTEAWFVLSAQPGSRAFAGLKPGVDEKVLRRALAEGTVADCLHSFEPRAGDCLFLPAGTVHAVGGGVVIAEVQQTSDATFRLYDWGRPRQLHVEQAMACIDWARGPVSPIRAEGYPQHPAPAAWPVRQVLVECPFFRLDYVCDRGPFAPAAGRMQVVVVLHGEGELHAQGEVERLKSGDAVLLPAALGETWVRPQDGTLAVLVASLPDADLRTVTDSCRERNTPCES
jgi:mannose-6-phosphate isomerase